MLRYALKPLNRVDALQKVAHLLNLVHDQGDRLDLDECYKQATKLCSSLIS